ncbi:hypothetical protein HYS47_02330 [Candidatus Woesearchaeota archaeon]|nr:hypothetical protein [Candidatus Woesearchaeota archaeon]
MDDKEKENNKENKKKEKGGEKEEAKKEGILHLVYDICRKKPMRNYLLFLFSVLLIILLFVASRQAFAILALLVLNAVLAFMVRPLKALLSGFELVTFSTVLFSIAYGPKTGLLVGLIFIIVNLFCIGRFTQYAVIMVPSVMLLGYFAFYLSGFGITIAGIIMTLIYNLLVILGIIVFLGGNPAKGISYIAVNTVWNIFLFSLAAPTVLNIIT